MSSLNRFVILLIVLFAPFILYYIFVDAIEVVQSQPPDEFLYPPYFDTTYVSNVFDHEFPVYCNDWPVDCTELDYAQYTLSSPHVITSEILHNNGIHYEDTNTDPYGYSGHDGVDYAYAYDYVLATHNGTVIEAGWDTPNHTLFGLLVRMMTEDEQYITIYGHMNTLMVKTGEEISSGTVLGISGNTGNSSGPHLHFTLLNALKRSDNKINPYGWLSASQDPWGNLQPSINHWASFPNISNSTIYSSGVPIIYPTGSPDPRLTPAIFSSYTTILDNNSTRFSTTGSWTSVPCTGSDCWDSTFHHTQGAGWFNSATWTPAPNQLIPAEYDVYVYLPPEPSNQTIEAVYQIKHLKPGTIIHSYPQVTWNQNRFRNRSSQRWAYLGRYAFSGNGQEYVKVWQAQAQSGNWVVADAVAFVLVDPPDMTLNITSSSGDAGSRADQEPCPGNTNTGHSEIYFGHCANGKRIASGFRFNNVGLPVGATILKAFLDFRPDGPFTNGLTLRFYGERATFPAIFSPTNPPSSTTRILTEAYTPWTIQSGDSWIYLPPAVPDRRYSPDMSKIVQEIVSLPGWIQSSSSIVILVRPHPFSNITPGGDPEPPYYRRVLARDRAGTNGILPPGCSFGTNVLIHQHALKWKNNQKS